MLTDLEQKIVDLIEERYERWQIAQQIGISENTIRRVIRNMCEYYQCPMRDLPEAVRKENEKGES